MSGKRSVTPQALQELGIKSVMPAEVREKFLLAYARTLNISKACKLAKVTLNIVQRELHNNPFFSARRQEIMDEALDELEELQMDSAKTKSDDRRWVLERARPDQWGSKRRVETLSVNVNAAKELSDAELERIISKNAVEASYDVEEDRPEGSGP